MKQAGKLAFVLAACLLLAGCGGGPALLFSPFQGTWTGTWVGGSADGTASITVDVLGDLTGTMHSDTSGLDGPLLGVIADDGDTTLTVTFPGSPAELGIGTLVLSGDGTGLSGTLNFGGDLVAFDLTKT